MVKFMMIFYKPRVMKDFEGAYNAFLAKVEQMPDIKRRQVNSIVGGPKGDSRFHRILEVYFDDFDHLKASLNSPQGQAAGVEIAKFPTGTCEMIFAEVYEEAGGQTPTEE